MGKASKQRKKRRPVRTVVIVLIIFLGLSGAGVLGYFQFAPPEKTCLSCHEIQPAYELWKVSAHQQVACKACHGGSLTAGIHGLVENAQRAIGHFRGAPDPEEIRLTERQVIRMQRQCRNCHAEAFAQWKAGGHAATYAQIFLDEIHNSVEQLNDDCLRCHGLFFAGSIDDLVTPISTEGPWHLLPSSRTDWPTMPCLACHEIHAEAVAPVGETANSHHPIRAKVDFYDRHEKRHFSAAVLPDAHITLNGEPIRNSSDPRQRVCLQCHAPESSEHAGTSDDKTPRGVHEALSCLACHQAHSNDARGSCALCHPAMSNCGLDVTQMDTSYASSDSQHDIHFVACEDCHTEGVPERQGGG